MNERRDPTTNTPLRRTRFALQPSGGNQVDGLPPASSLWLFSSKSNTGASSIGLGLPGPGSVLLRVVLIIFVNVLTCANLFGSFSCVVICITALS